MRGDRGSGRVRTDEPDDLPRSDEGRRPAGPVRADDHGRGRHRERPGAAASGRGPLLARPRRFRRAALRGRRGRRARDGRPDLRGRRRADADPGTTLEGPDPGPARRRRRRPSLLPLRRGVGRPDPPRRVAHGVDRRGGLRALPVRHGARRRPVRARHGGGEPVRRAGDRPERGAADRGRHLQLRLGHARVRHPVARQRARATRRAGSGAGLPREGGAPAPRGDRGRSQAGRDRDRRRADDRRGSAERLLARARARRRGRSGASRPAPGRRVWSATSATRGCRPRTWRRGPGSRWPPCRSGARPRSRRSRSSTRPSACPCRDRVAVLRSGGRLLRRHADDGSCHARAHPRAAAGGRRDGRRAPSSRSGSGPVSSRCRWARAGFPWSASTSRTR